MRRINTSSTDQLILQKLFGDTGVSFEYAPSAELYYYINNKDGTMRWVFEANLSRPTYLKLYNSSTIKGKLYKLVSRVFFGFGMQRFLISGVFYAVKSNISILSALETMYPRSEYSIFTGTAGENRKIVIEIETAEGAVLFVKIPFGKNSGELINNEASFLMKMRKLDLLNMSVPDLILINNKMIALSDVGSSNAESCLDFTDVHISALMSLSKLTLHYKTIPELIDENKVLDNIQFIADHAHTAHNLNSKYLQGILVGLVELSNSIRKDDIVSCSYSHGDFTPWNMYKDEHKLYVYDWELASETKPMFFDLFHFVFASSILIKRDDFTSIKRELSKIFKQDVIIDFVRNNKIDVQEYLKLYLLLMVSNYVKLYLEQAQLHEQAHWQVLTWSEAISATLL